jgi:hypothetical protein
MVEAISKATPNPEATARVLGRSSLRSATIPLLPDHRLDDP